MKITNSMSDSAIANELFERIELQRKALKLTQDAIAKSIGISRKSYSAAIKNGKTSLINFIAILRHLELLENLELIGNKPEQSPMTVFKAERVRNLRRNYHYRTRQPAENLDEGLKNDKKEILVGTGPGAEAFMSINPILASRQKLKVRE